MKEVKGKKLVAVALLLSAATVAVSAEPPEAEQADGRKTMRAAMERWIETEKLISAEKTEWQVDQEIIRDRMSVLTNETALLKSTTAGINADYAASSGKLDGYLREQEQYKVLSDALSVEVGNAEKRVLAILKRAPAAIREKVRPLSQRIPEKPEEAKTGLGERVQNVVGILNEINKFARDITLTSEVMTPSGGDGFEASVIYFGLGQGYYVNQLGTVAGYGLADGDGWVWVSSNELGQSVLDVIAIHRTEKVAAYVTLPIHIK